ncbi:MAG TPA: Uma2 family endonuclease, partial [Saprospiraceae bacterium]|nr:Uma2 family endonuclease [Saprospiraceae bacterium]
PPSSAPRRRYTVQEYLEIERKTGEKHIFLNGIVLPMAGAKPSHIRITRNVLVELCNALAERDDAEAFPNDTKIYLPLFRHYYYPDALAVVGKAEFSDDEAGAITNPILIVEVLSDSTAAFDKGQKFGEYKILPSFREHVLIYQDSAQVDSYLRDEQGDWQKSSVTGPDQSILFQSIGVQVTLSSIYRHVEMAP